MKYGVGEREGRVVKGFDFSFVFWSLIMPQHSLLLILVLWTNSAFF